MSIYVKDIQVRIGQRWSFNNNMPATVTEIKNKIVVFDKNPIPLIKGVKGTGWTMRAEKSWTLYSGPKITIRII